MSKEKILFYRTSGDWGFLSNLYACEVMMDGRVFPSAEAAYQFGKPKELRVAEWLVTAPKQRLIATTAHALLTYDVREDWNQTKVDRMRRVVRLKFEQNDYLRQRLLETANADLVENSGTDSFWGIGASGKGKNMLGRILMETREALRSA